MSIQGPGDYYDGIAYAMKRAHSRVVLAMGGDTAFAEMLERLPLSPQDHDIISLSAEVAGWSDELMARPKAKAKAKSNAAGSSAPPPVASSRIGLALHRRPQVPPVAPSDSNGNGAAVASNVMPVASDPNARVVSNAAKSPPPQGPPPQVPPQHPLPNAPPVRMNMPPPRPPPAVAAPTPLTVDQLLDEARAKAPGGAPNAPPPIEDAPHVPNAPERPMCCICQDFVSEDPNENTCPPCGHVFHADCVRRLREVADQQGRILPENYCSFRCHESLDAPQPYENVNALDRLAAPDPEAVPPEQELNHEVERDRAEIEELFN